MINKTSGSGHRSSGGKKLGGAAVYFAVFCVLVVAFFVYGGKADPSVSGPLDDFAQCLTDNKAVMFGTDWCKYCQSQKKMFDSSFSKIDFVNCDFHASECNGAGVEGYPTWYVGDQNLGGGVQPLEKLGELTGCGEFLPSDSPA